MDTTITRLADFVSGTAYEDLSPRAAEECRRILTDSLGCALAGTDSDKGRWGMAYGNMFYGGEAQATVIGHGRRLSAPGAVFVNAELINGLDYDASGKHLPPFVIPPALAAAEMGRRSGKELVAAVALALEIGTRIGKAMGSYRDVKDGKVVGLPPVTGHSCSVFGGAAGVAKLEGFSSEMTAQAMGMAGLISPANTQTPMHKDLPTNSGKYLLAGWAAQTGFAAPYLIKCGHRSDINILDGDYGYWRYIGASSWDAAKVTSGLGDDWLFVKNTPIKQFPCCRMMHGGLECLIDIISENELRPEEIEDIHAFLEVTCTEPVFHNKNIENQIDAQFSVAYNMAVAALGIKPGPQWQSPCTMKRADLRPMMDKVRFEPHAGNAGALKNDPNARISRVEVTARGKVFACEKMYIKGTVTDDPATSFTDDEIGQKFMDNACTALPKGRAEQVLDMLVNIERLDDVNELLDLMHP